MPEHNHAAQWTIVISGSCTFTANFIPAGLKHQITLHAGYSEFDYVDDPLDGEIGEKKFDSEGNYCKGGGFNCRAELLCWIEGKVAGVD